jgi:hypothetical protein
MSKFGNKKHLGYDSKREARRASDLAILEKIGEIQNLRHQVRFELTPKAGKERASHYIADFVYQEGGKEVIEDAKGFRTPLYVLKRKIMRYRYGIEIKES